MTDTTRRTEDSRDLGGFESELRRWGRREPSTSAARATAHLRQRLAQRPARGFPWRSPVLALAFGLLVAVGVSLLAVVLAPERDGVGLEAADRAPWEIPETTGDLDPRQASPTHQGNDGVVLIWLDESTPLYMTFAPPAGAREKGPS